MSFFKRNQELADLYHRAKWAERRYLDFYQTDFGRGGDDYLDFYQAIFDEYELKRSWFHPRLKTLSSIYNRISE